MGTGSVDVLLNAAYTIRWNDFGVNSSAQYKLNTVNADAFRFGNRFNLNSFAFYRAKVDAIILTPNAGMIYEHSAANYLNGLPVDQTGGYLLNASLGVECAFKKISVGLNVQLPVAQNFAQGQTQANTRAVFHIAFAI